MPQLNILQDTVRLRNTVTVKREVLEIDKLIDPHTIRQVEGQKLFEWRAKTDCGCARIVIFGFSKNINEIPKRWYPLQDNEPMTKVMTDGEMREAAVMAVRGECYEQCKFPESVKSIDALIILMRMIDEEPDLVFANWARQALHNDEIYFFIREWEKDYNKRAPEELLPTFIV